MSGVKRVYRNIETDVKKAARGLGGTDVNDRIGNAGDEARKDLGNLGDDIRKVGREASTPKVERGPER